MAAMAVLVATVETPLAVATLGMAGMEAMAGTGAMARTGAMAGTGAMAVLAVTPSVSDAAAGQLLREEPLYRWPTMLVPAWPAAILNLRLPRPAAGRKMKLRRAMF
jgi:hypothetical protein